LGFNNFPFYYLVLVVELFFLFSFYYFFFHFSLTNSLFHRFWQFYFDENHTECALSGAFHIRLVFGQVGAVYA